MQIQGGVQTSNHEFPFLVSLQYKYGTSTSHKCCGSIIAKRFILTAGHCGYNSYASNYAVLMGVTTLSECAITKTIFSSGSTIMTASNCVVARVKTIHLHPSYDDFSLNNDIAIFELYDEIPYSSTIYPVSLATKLPTYNAIQIVSGWGITSSTTNTAADHLMKVNVPYVDEKYCNDLGLDVSSTDGKLCAGAGDGKDACAGDSGSGLFYAYNTTIFIEIGIVSYGPNNCGTPDASTNRGVYTSIPFHQKWIKSISNVSTGINGYSIDGTNTALVSGSSSNVHSSLGFASISSQFRILNIYLVIILECLVVAINSAFA